MVWSLLMHKNMMADAALGGWLSWAIVNYCGETNWPYGIILSAIGGVAIGIAHARAEH